MTYFSGFDEDDMEKPKFSFPAPSEKTPFCLDDNAQVGVKQIFRSACGVVGYI